MIHISTGSLEVEDRTILINDIKILVQQYFGVTEFTFGEGKSYLKVGGRFYDDPCIRAIDEYLCAAYGNRQSYVYTGWSDLVETLP